MSDGMVGREYTWAGRRWRVLCRWRTPALTERSWACPGCGHIVTDKGSWACECVPMPDIDWSPRVVRNVLIQDVVSGELVTRPFRGLRKPRLRALPDRKQSALGWELRTLMAKCQPVRLTLSERCDGVFLNPEGQRVLEGLITSVSATNAFCTIQDRHVPLAEIRAVTKPHFHQAPASDPTTPLERAREPVQPCGILKLTNKREG